MNDHRHYLDRDVAWDQGQGKGIDREGKGGLRMVAIGLGSVCSPRAPRYRQAGPRVSLWAKNFYQWDKERQTLESRAKGETLL
nr:hypothetical protein Q903MT_gene2311 [Picea sitchensis]